MPIILNGTTFNNGGTVTFNGSPVKEIIFGTTTVWKSQSETYTLNASGAPSSYNSGQGESDNLSSAIWRTATMTVPSGYSKLTITAFTPAGLYGATQTQLLESSTVKKDTGKRYDYATVTSWTNTSVSVTSGSTITFRCRGAVDVNRSTQSTVSASISFYFE